MIGLDTNILVRYLADDDHVRSPRATDLIEQQLTPEMPGFVSVVAIVETAWVLNRSYSFPVADIAYAISLLLGAPTLVVEHAQLVFDAMTLFENGKGDFSDILIGLLDQRAGCSHTLTFDRRASRLAGFQLLT
jgi:predicted nucleic-acid-binding protein